MKVLFISDELPERIAGSCNGYVIEKILRTQSLWDRSREPQITAADGSVSHKQYNGLDTVSINPQGQRKTETHNSLGEVVTVTDNLGGQTHYRHDALGQLTTMRDANGNQTQLVYDALGRKLSMNDWSQEEPMMSTVSGGRTPRGPQPESMPCTSLVDAGSGRVS